MERMTIEMPDDLAKNLKDRGGDPSRRVLEIVAVAQYREGKISEGRVGELLGLTFWETQDLLRKQNAYLHYSAVELREDAAAHGRK
jgi:predicted HTH domain antitoxin